MNWVRDTHVVSTMAARWRIVHLCDQYPGGIFYRLPRDLVISGYRYGLKPEEYVSNFNVQ